MQTMENTIILKVLFLLLCTINGSIAANTQLVLNWAKVEYSEKKYLDLNIAVFKYNRTAMACNNTFYVLKELPADLMIRIKTYEFLSNEYKPFAIDVTTKYCDFVKNEYKMFFYKDFLKTGGRPVPPVCPIEVDNYSMYNYVPQATFYPSTIPFKKTKLEASWILHDKIILKFSVFVTFDSDYKYRTEYEGQ